MAAAHLRQVGRFAYKWWMTVTWTSLALAGATTTFPDSSAVKLTNRLLDQAAEHSKDVCVDASRHLGKTFLISITAVVVVPFQVVKLASTAVDAAVESIRQNDIDEQHLAWRAQV